MPWRERHKKKLELDGKTVEERKIVVVEERKTAAVDERTIAVEEHKKAQQRKLALGHMMEKEPVRRLVENRTVVQVQGMLVQVRTLELELGRMLAQVRMMEL